MSIESVMPSNHLILCCPLLLLPSIFPSIRVFFNESVPHITWPKYWSFSINPSNEYSGWISFRMDWFDLLAVQGTLKSSPAYKCPLKCRCNTKHLLPFSLGYVLILTISACMTKENVIIYTLFVNDRKQLIIWYFFWLRFQMLDPDHVCRTHFLSEYFGGFYLKHVFINSIQMVGKLKHKTTKL